MINKNEIQYYKGGLTSQGHTPVYKMHKYFARRPFNVFNSLIQHYSKKGDVIFDPFGGGGVTLIEGLTCNRRVISCDINPISSFIQFAQTLQVDVEEFVAIAGVINQSVYKQFQASYETKCSKCRKSSHVRWFEHAYLVNCPSCNNLTSLINDNLAKNDVGKNKAGVYICECCKCSFRSVNSKRIASKLVGIRFKCDSCGTQANKNPDQTDIDKFDYFNKEIENIIEELNLQIPKDKIPAYWDRQQEDCLHKKGFYSFADLFTKRNLILSAYYFNRLETFKNSISESLYSFILFNISSLLRYTNNMSFSTSTWMDGRPVAWAKHAYWMPNQFIEVNPIEYFDNRIKASISGLKDQTLRFENKSPSLSVMDFFKNEKDYCVICNDSSKIDIPNNSIDVVITDPPYGSNVQYSELSAFWYVWIKDKTTFKVPDFLFSDEAVVHRKTKTAEYSKDFQEYENKLKDIFSKCFNVLKPNGCLVFTFNNKNIKAWYSVIKAVTDSGFYLDPDGVVYQEPIDAYRDTAHQRFEGTPQGDYIYTFKKEKLTFEEGRILSLDESIKDTIESFLVNGNKFSFDEFMIKLFSKSIHSIIQRITKGENEASVISSFNALYISKKLSGESRIELLDNVWVPKILQNVVERVDM